MRELSVYYCQKCAYYGYYQLPKNAICPKCNSKMKLLEMRYQDFMDLDYHDRDELLAQELINSSASIVMRLSAPQKAFNSRETIAHLVHQIEELEAENKKLNETVNWMHKTIWNLLRKSKKLEKLKNT